MYLKLTTPLAPAPSPIWAVVVIALLMMLMPAPGKAADQPSPLDNGWAMAEVIADSALIHHTPNEVSFITGTAQSGDLIWIKNLSNESQWLQIRSTQGSISWILQSDISEIRKGEGRIKSTKATIRPGRLGARLPGPPGMEIQKGATVWLLPNAPLLLPQRGGLITWRAIEPPTDEPRFIRKDQVRRIDNRKPSTEEGFVDSEGPGTLANSTPKRNPRPLPPKIQPPANAPPEIDQGSPLVIARSNPAPEPDQKPNETKPPGIDALEILDAPDPDKPLQRKIPIDNGPDLILDSDPAALPDFAPLMPAPPGNEVSTPGPNKNPGGNVKGFQGAHGKVSPLELPADPDQALELLESRFRVVVAQPLISWDFRSILASCETMQGRPMSPSQTARLHSLRDKAERQDEIGRSSRQFWESMRRSRSHDPNRMKSDDLKLATSRNRFDISGLMLPSTRDVDGQLLYNLIGDTGATIAYLKMPPAAPIEKWVGKRVGIRGRVRYHEDLRARLVSVQDVELLEPEED
ncbi:MAG: hypothetical protein NT172_16140 [Planctomycetota bacterium]|nr:hypothetical protein [Planctomycetota bacterium]